MEVAAPIENVENKTILNKINSGTNKVYEHAKAHPYVYGGIIVGVASYYAFPFVANYVGFSPAGVVKGSWAASLHSKIHATPVLMKGFGFFQSITTKSVVPQMSRFIFATKDTIASAATIAKTAREAAFLVTFVTNDSTREAARSLAMRVSQATQDATQYTQDTTKSAAQNALRISHEAAYGTARMTHNAALATKDAAQNAVRVTQETAQEVTRKTVDAARYATQATVGAARSGYAWVSGEKKEE